MHYIIYKTTCTVTGKWYIGMHSTKKLNDTYLGSGIIIANSVKKYGRENHVREILHVVETHEEMRKLEEQIVTKELIADPMCMNLAVGGCGSGAGRVVTEKTRAIFREQRKGWAHMDPESRERLKDNLIKRQKGNRGDKSPRSKEWTLQSPEGHMFVTCAMNDFCSERNLNYFSLRNRALFGDIRPITRGPSRGWAVLKYQDKP